MFVDIIIIVVIMTMTMMILIAFSSSNVVRVKFYIYVAWCDSFAFLRLFFLRLKKRGLERPYNFGAFFFTNDIKKFYTYISVFKKKKKNTRL